MNNCQNNVLTLVKDGEMYLFLLDNASRKALLGVFGRFAANPDLNFSWHDAAVLSRRIRETAENWQSPGKKGSSMGSPSRPRG